MAGAGRTEAHASTTTTSFMCFPSAEERAGATVHVLPQNTSSCRKRKSGYRSRRTRRNRKRI